MILVIFRGVYQGSLIYDNPQLSQLAVKKIYLGLSLGSMFCHSGFGRVQFLSLALNVPRLESWS